MGAFRRLTIWSAPGHTSRREGVKTSLADPHHVCPVADSLRASHFDGLPHVKPELLWRHESKREFPSVQSHVHAWIRLAEEPEHLHVQVVVPHREEPVFRHDQVHADDSRIRGGQLEREHRLGEHLLRRQAAQGIRDESHRDIAARYCRWRGASECRARFSVDRIEPAAAFAEALPEALCRQESLTQQREVLVGLPRHPGRRNVYQRVERPHQLQMAHVLERRAVDNLGDTASDEPRRGIATLSKDSVEFPEGIEELVMTGNASRLPVPHGECIDDAAIQHGIVRYLRRRALRDGVGAGAGTGGRVDEGQGGHVDAQRQISRPPNVASA